MREVEVLKQEMDRLDVNNKELSEKMFCSPSLVSKRLRNPTHDFIRRAAKALDSIRLKMLVYGDTTAPVYFENAYIDIHSTLDKMEEEASQLLDYIQELKRKRNYHNARDVKECSKELEKAYYTVAEKNKDLNHCTEHLDIALDDFGLDLDKRDKVCNLKYIDRGYVPQKATPKNKKDTCPAKASAAVK